MPTQIIETVHAYNGFWGSTGHCGLQIFPGRDGIPVVILTELPSNDSTSVTNLIESLAAEVLEKYLPHRLGQTPPFHCIEHYPETRDRGETFDQVGFELNFPERHPSTLRVDLSGSTPSASTQTRLSPGHPNCKVVVHRQVDALF
jgi:hypothetical protein